MKKLIAIYFIVLSMVSFAQIDRSKAPKAQPNPEINIPTPKIDTLENGLKVVIVENHKLPKISFQLFIDNPPVLEKDKVGLSELAGDMLGAGTADYTKSEFDETIDFIGASFYPSSNGFYASSLTKHSDKLLKLLKSVITSPSFPDSEFERIKTQYLSGLSSQKSDPNSMASNVANVINYGSDHFYGEIMTEESVKNITTDDLKSYFNTYFKPNNAYLVIVGDISEEKGKTIAKEYFGDWEASKYKMPEVNYSTPSNTGNQVYFVNKPGAVQSVISITHTIDLKPGHPDAIKLSVLNSILGGGSFSARLMRNLREDKAYTYGCYSNIKSDKLKGEFSAGGSFRNEVTDSAVTQILLEINKIRDEYVTDAELDLVKKSRTGAFARNLEDPQTVANFALNTIRYNLPENYYRDYLKKLEAITKEDLLKVAKSYLSPDKINIVIVGNEEIAHKLKGFDSNSKVDFMDGLGNAQAKLKTAPEGVTATTIINNYLSKVYMTDDQKMIDKKNKKIRYISREYDGIMTQMGAAFKLTTASAAPNKEAMILKVNGNTIQKEYFNGATGKMVSMQGEEVYDKNKIAEKSLPSFPFSQSHYINSEQLTVNLLGIDEIDGKAYYKLEIKNKLSEELSFEYYNTKTGLLEIKESLDTTEDGKLIENKVKLSNYKPYGKGSATILMASKQIMNNNGNTFELVLKSTTIGKRYSSSVFEGGMK